MKFPPNIIKISLFIAFSAFIFTSSCARGAGCPAQDGITAKTNKKGQLKSKKTKHHLFSKKMRRN
jgi:hypothetical protein